MKHVLSQNTGDMEFTFVHYQKSENPIYRLVHELIVPRNPLVASAILRKKAFDIIHYANLSVFAPLWGIKAKKTATVHGIEEILFPQGYSLIHRLHETRYRPLLMRLMDGIATVSYTTRRYMINRYHLEPDKIFITTNGLSPCFKILSETERKTPELRGKKYILHISRYSARKNPKTIIQGFAEFIKETGLDYFLICAGKGWDNAEALKTAERTGIKDRYYAPGFISEAGAVQLLNSAEVFLFPSFAEGFGMPNIEAMACGCPVITSNVFAIPEIVGDAAYILTRPDSAGELAQGIIKIVKDEEYRNLLIRRGLEKIKKYSWDDSARNLIQYWKKLVSPGLLSNQDGRV
jgi:glycosyltransferase involved in cell wall biosynthesis